MSLQEAKEEYLKANKQALKEYKELVAAGKSPHPAVLDEIRPKGSSDIYTDIGLVEIPIERIVGTKSAGRITAFTPTFLPLLDPSSEFANKWMILCDAHLSAQGIRDPILCFEYLGNFYVQEGNKRVSVLRSFGSPRITGNVLRIMPEKSDDPRVIAYMEFLDFYKDSKIYDVQFTQPGQYAKLLSALGKEPGSPWSQWDCRTFNAYISYFKEAFQKLSKGQSNMTWEEALLMWLEVYSFRDIGRLSSSELLDVLSQMWKDLEGIAEETPVAVSVAPTQQSASLAKVISRLILPTPNHVNVAFIHPLDPTISAWVKGHDTGREYLEMLLGDKVTVRSYFHADTPQQAQELLEQAVTEGADLVFTTSPQLSRATLRAALKYPKVRFLNCSLDVPYSNIRSYYSRMYEAKFITGAIAGAMADDDRIGYIGDYPIYGVPASINAFALGAQMTNPRAKVDLRWTCLPGNPVAEFAQLGYEVISNRDVPTHGQGFHEYGAFGTYFVDKDGTLTPLASPIWQWGNFYEEVTRSVLEDTWEQNIDSKKPLNYWWGLSSGIIDVEMSPKLPDSIQYLAKVLRQGLQDGSIDPFARRIVAQDGTVKNDGSHRFTPDELLHMDWLCENVTGFIPEFHQVLPVSQPMVRELGLHRESIPREKEEADAL